MGSPSKAVNLTAKGPEDTLISSVYHRNSLGKQVAWKWR